MSQRQRHRTEQHRRRRTQLAAAGGVVALVALGGIVLLPIGDGSSDAIEISMVEYAFDPVDATARPGQELQIANDGAIAHNYLIADLGKGIELESGDEGTLQVPPDAESGSYRVICDLSGHVEAGMVGTLEVR